MIVVIGSGPAGISAAQALCARGLDVTLVDGGVALETERAALVDDLAARSPNDWPAEAVEQIRRQSDLSIGGIPVKYTYGSDFPYREVERALPFELRGVEARPTLARGGFSTVWGSCVLPYLEEDLADWPVSQAELAPHYRAVTRWMPLSARSDDLEAELPLYCDAPQPLRPSAQAQALMRDLERSRARLGRAGIRFGWSRLGVRAERSERGPGCVECGLCLNGCPHRLIYDAGATLDELVAGGSLTYRPGVVVDRIEERQGRVELRGRELRGGAAFRMEAERLYVACGAIGTTRLLLASLDRFDQPIELCDSQYFLLPLLRLAGSPRVREESLHTLCQVFVELRDPSVDPHNVHLQIYGYNDLYRALFEGFLGRLARPARPAVDALLARTLLIQGYLHSDSSPRIAATLERRDGGEVLRLEERINPATRPALRRVVRRLLAQLPALRALPLFPAMMVAAAGRGFHTGGSFPMREQPSDLECDVLGRPHGFERVHLVDSSTFPTIPSTTITFTTMANAHRIASAEM